MPSKLLVIVLYIEKGGTYLFFENENSILTVFPSEFLKKKDTFNYQFFERNLNLQSDLLSKQLESCVYQDIIEKCQNLIFLKLRIVTQHNLLVVA